MKLQKIKRLPALLLALALAVSLAACGASYNSASTDAGTVMQSFSAAEAAVETADVAEEKETTDADTAGTSDSVYDNADVKLIRRATLSVEATDLDAACASLETLVETLGGYLEDSSVYQGSYGSEYRSASYTVRVPSEQYDAFLSGVESDGACHLVSREESTEDVGQEYADTETHIKALKTKLERLNELMAQAENMKDIISIESAITEAEQELASYSSNLNRYDDLIGYATINVSIEQVEDLTEVTPEKFTDRVAAAFLEGCGRFWDGLQDFAVWVAGNIWSILVVLLLLFLALRLRSWWRKRRTASRQDRKQRKRKARTERDGYQPAYQPKQSAESSESALKEEETPEKTE